MSKDEEILKFWEKSKIYEQIKKASKGKKKFYFLDGPPYASGHIHMGTALNKTLKDFYIRFWRMYGFDVWDQPGYDTHGLPIEKKVESLLKIKSKGEIEIYGVDKFNSQCKKFATEFIDVMNKEFERIGVWMNWDDPYLTLKNEYIESAWATFKIAFQKGLLYKGLYPVHVCPNCETAVAYNEIVYQTKEDPSIYVKFKVQKEISKTDVPDEYLLIWTTTPWTLLANTGVMVHPHADYVKVEIGGEVLIMAKALLEQVMKKVGKSDFTIIDEFKGKELEGLTYTNPLEEWVPDAKNIAETGWCVVTSEQFVVLTEGTGIVHTAPGHGEEDFKVGKEKGLPIVCFIGLDGKYIEGKLKGHSTKEGNQIIIEELENRGALLSSDKISHEYPTCWRCETPLLFMATPQWHFKVTAIRDRLLKENEKTNWQPDWAQARFKNWLENLGDWPIGRQRYWGIPLPIWVCEKNENHITVVGSVKELGKKLKDLHRPYVDEIELKCKSCKGIMKRVEDVLDVWFDAGLASWASLGWPMDKKLFNKLWPADLNIEGPDQFRGWWNSQLITSVILFGKAPFRNIVLHGFILDAKGIKMSKSKGNVVTPEEIINKGFPIDVLRFYFLSNPPWNDYYFNWKELEAVNRSLGIIKNSLNFVNTYVPSVSSSGKSIKLLPEDKWILSRMNSIITEATEAAKNYESHKAAVLIKDFAINEFSRVYIKLVRDRVWPQHGKDEAAYYTLYTVSETLCKLLAPFTPFFAEELYQDFLKGKLKKPKDSVHLFSWPKAGKSDKKLEDMMKKALQISELANACRNEVKIKLRWPLREIIVDESLKDVAKTLGNVICELSNIKKVSSGIKTWSKSVDDINIWLNTEMDGELKKEAGVREIIRLVQENRKQDGMIIKDKIVLSVEGFDIKGFEEEIKSEVGAASIGNVKDGKTAELDFEGVKIIIVYKKI